MTILRAAFTSEPFCTSPWPGPVPKPKNDDSVQARPLKRSRFGSLERRLPPVLALLRGPGQQSQRHGATQTRPWSAIPKTRRHPRDTPTSNPQDTAPPTRRPDQQSLRHGATQTTPWSAIPKTRRHPRDTPTRNPQDTAPPRQRPGQQSLRHGATHATRRPAILKTRRHPGDALISNP